MEVKGAAVVSIPKYVKKNFPERYEEWLDSLSERSKDIMEYPLTSMWYPMEEAISEPTKKLCELFFDSKLIGARECGKFSAEHALKGIYRFFVRMGSPSFILSRASRILPTYYMPSKIELSEMESKYAVLTITEFPESTVYIEERIKGWIIRALELSGCRGVMLDTVKSLTKGHEFTRFKVSWN